MSQAVVYRLHQEAHCEAKSGRYFGGSSLQTDELGDLGRLSPSLPLRLNTEKTWFNSSGSTHFGIFWRLTWGGLMLGEKGFVFIQTLSFFRVGSWREHVSLQMLVAPFRECDCRTSTVRLAVPSPKRWLVHSVFKGEPHAVSRAKSTIIEDCPVQ